MAIIIALHQIHIISDIRIFTEMILYFHIFPVTDKQAAFIGGHPDASEGIFRYVIGPICIPVTLLRLYLVIIKPVIHAIILSDTTIRRYPYIVVTVFIYMTDSIVLERMAFRVSAKPGHIPVITQMDESVLSRQPVISDRILINKRKQITFSRTDQLGQMNVMLNGIGLC
jgi:hypothetical protein